MSTNRNFPAAASSNRVIGAALAHLALERAAACVLPVPDTDPPLFVAVGSVPAIVQLLQDAINEARPQLAISHVDFDESEGGHHD